MDLPTDGEKLQHYTLQRPRPNRTLRQPPKKPHVLPSEISKIREDIVCTKVDDGIDDFFSRKYENEKAPSGTSTEPVVTSSGSRTLKKKIGEFFALRKPRSSKSFKLEKDSEGDPVTVKGKKQTLTDILKPLKGSETIKENDKEDSAVSAEAKSVVDPTWTPDAARRIKPRYAREGKSQSLILLSGDDEEAIGIKKKLYEKSEACSTFEHRVHSMLHRIGVMRVLSSESKKKQGKDGEIKKAGSEGDIVDSESHPPALNARTQSLSTERTTPKTTESVRNVEEDFARQLNAELKNKCLEIQASPRRSDITPQDIRLTLEKAEDTKSLPGLEKIWPVSSPNRFSHLEGASKGKKDISESIKTDEDLLKPRIHLKHLQNRRAVSVHEDQFRNHGFTSELENVKFPQPQRSPLLKLKQRSEATTSLSSEPACTSLTQQEPEKSDLEEKPAFTEPAQVIITEGNVTQSPVETVQNAAICQRTAIKPSEPPSDSN